MRGVVRGDVLERLTIEETVAPGGWFSRWAAMRVNKEQYRKLGEVTAWRVTLWEDNQMLGEQQSFLW
jgi:hypothetical protein